MSNDQDASDSRRREIETLNESARRKREEAVRHHMEAFRLQLDEQEHAGKADKLGLEIRYLERATIARHDDEIREAEKEVRAKEQEINRVVQEADGQQLVAELEELRQTAEQKWDQRGQYKKQLNESEEEFFRLRSIEFHAAFRAKELNKLVWKLVKEAEEAENRAKKIFVDDQQELEELPHTLD